MSYRSYFISLRELQDKMPFLWHNKDYQLKFLNILIEKGYFCGTINCETKYNIKTVEDGFQIEQWSEE